RGTLLSSLIDAATELADGGQARFARMLISTFTSDKDASAPKLSDAGATLIGKLDHLADSLERQNDPTDAESIDKLAIQWLSNWSPRRDAELARERGRLAKLYTSMSKYGAAEELYRLALSVQEKELGLRNAETMETLEGLIKLDLARKDISAAKALMPKL